MSQHTITLPVGHQYREGADGAPAKVHKTVVFGRRPTAADLIKLDADPLASLETQRTLLAIRSAITKFGEMTLPQPPLSVLMGLCQQDREALVEGYVEFLQASLGERVSESLSEHEYKLAFGLKVGSETYDVLVFVEDEPSFTGYDDLKLERKYGTGLRRDMAVIGREVARLAQSEGGLTLDGEASAETLERMDSYDLHKLLEVYAARRDNFRRTRGSI